MERTIGYNLYTWYQEVKKKDLGASQNDWLQKLQEQALTRKKEQEQYRLTCICTENEDDKNHKRHNSCSVHRTCLSQRYANVDDACPKNIRGEQGKERKLNESIENISTKSSKCSTPRTPTKQIKSPFSALLDSSFITPTLVLSQADDGTPETSHRSDFNADTLGLDLFSPLISEGNTSTKVAASLGANLDDSLASWSSALATPLATDTNGQPKRTSPTTLERLTLHPKQGLRQKVMARTLFSPRTPGTNKPKEGSPNLGIIKCYSPIPSFNNRAIIQQRRLVAEISHDSLLGDTQSFKICDHVNKGELKTAPFPSGSNLVECIPAGFDSDDDSYVHEKKNTSSTDKSALHLHNCQSGCSMEDDVTETKISQCSASSIVKDAMTLKIVDDQALVKRGKHSSFSKDNKMLDRVIDSEDCQSKSPFDLICSPVKSKVTQVTQAENKFSTAGHAEDLWKHSVVEKQNGNQTKEEASLKLPIPMFRKEVLKQEGKQDEDNSNTDKSKNVLSKLSLHKKKRFSGRFLYPRKSEEGYEKLNMKYQETLTDNRNFIVEADMVDVAKEEMLLEMKPPKISNNQNIPSKQQTFVPLTKFERDDQFGQINLSRDGELHCHYDILPNSHISTKSQTDKVIQQSSIPEVSLEKLKGQTDSTPMKAMVINAEDKAECKFRGIQHQLECPSTSSEPQVVPQKKKNMTRKENTGSINGSQKSKTELPLSQSLVSSSCETMDDSFNDIDFAEIDLNFSVPNVNADSRIYKNKNCIGEINYGDFSKSNKGFCGFSTGRGKPMKVSDKALEHAKKLLEETDEELSGLNGNVAYESILQKKDLDSKLPAFGLEANAIGNSTENVSCTELLISSKSTRRAMKVSEAENPVEDRMTKNKLDGNIAAETRYSRFSTNVSENSLQCARKVSEQTADDFQNYIGNHSLDSEFTLQETGNLFSMGKDLEKSSMKANTEDLNIGFKTASGLDIKVSSEAIDRVRRQWEDVSEEIGQSLNILCAESDKEKDPMKESSGQVCIGASFSCSKTKNKSEIESYKSLPCQGFSTPLGKGEASLKRAQMLMEDDVKESEMNCNDLVENGKIFRVLESIPKEIKEKTVSVNSKNAYGYTNKQVMEQKRNALQVPEAREDWTNAQSLQEQSKESKVGQMADMIGNYQCTDSRNENEQQFRGFATAGGSKIRVSEAALLKGQKMWEENNDLQTKKSVNLMEDLLLGDSFETPVISTVNFSTLTSDYFQGFSTGRGKKVTVSKDALARAQKILNDDDTSSYSLQGEEKGNASSVCVPKYHSDEKKNIGQRITQEKLISEERSDGKEHTLCLGSGSFVTGRGRSIKVSEESLKRANLLMEEQNLQDSAIIPVSDENSFTEVKIGITGKVLKGKEKSPSKKTRKLGSKDSDAFIIMEMAREELVGSKHDRERTPSPVLGSQKTLMKGVEGGRMSTGCLKRKFSEMSSDEQGSEKQVAKKLSSKDSRRKKGYSQSPPMSAKMCSSPAMKPHSLPSVLASSSKTEVSESLKPQNRSAPPDTQEISAITEAFLADDLIEEAGLLESNSKKRARETEEGNKHSCKKFKDEESQLVCSQEENKTTVITEAIESEREMVRLKQLKSIRYKEKRSIQPVQGVLHKLRNENKNCRIKMQSLGPLKIHGKISEKVTKISADNSKSYRFPVHNLSCVSVSSVEGCNLVPGTDGHIGVDEIERGFLAAPGVHPGLLPPGWVANHYQWIVWNLAALERRLLHCQVLTVENVVIRLKYRYDREIDRAERPILRKIMEHDDVPQKSMILCVTCIKTNNESSVNCAMTRPRSPNMCQGMTLVLTDGWYSTDGIIDAAMEKLISEEKVKVGTKLVIHGAEMARQAQPSHPLQASSPMCLRLHTNMTRRAKWWSRLGLIPQNGPLPTAIDGILGDGGLVGRLEVLLARIYPPLYFEKMAGKSVFRSERTHFRIIKENQQQKERNIQQVLAEVEQEYDLQTSVRNKSKNGNSLSNEEIRNLASGKEIAQLMEEALDPSSLEGLLSPHQIELARSWRQKELDERQRKIGEEVQKRLAKKQSVYEAVTVLKVRIMDVEGDSAIVTIWRPTEELRQSLSEGTVYAVHYLCAGGHRYGNLQLTATRQSRWERITKPSFSDFKDVARHVTPFCLLTSDELDPVWKEVDIVGVVLRLGRLESGSQMLYLVDHHGNIVALKFWGGIKESGVEDFVQIGVVICVSNGSWRGHVDGMIPCIHVTELTSITTQPRSHHLDEQAMHIKRSIRNMKTLLQEGDIILDGHFNNRTSAAESTTAIDTDNRSNRSIQNIEELKSTESTHTDMGNQESKEDTPGSSLNLRQQRSREIRSKLKALGSYGTPSVLRSLKSPASSGTHKPFRAPLRQPKQSNLE